MAGTATIGGENGDSAYPSAGRAWLTVAVLIVAYIFSYLDRQILSLMIEPVKHDLRLNDTQIGLIQGFFFAVFLAVAGLAIGRWIDTGRRLKILALGILFWSAMTVCCGLSRSFYALLVFRLGVGIGEAALTPAAYSVMSDSFSPKRLGLAFSVYGLGSYIGIGISYFAGAVILNKTSHLNGVGSGVTGGLHPWQVAFILVGLPGLVVAYAIQKLKEPRRAAGDFAQKPTLSEVARYFRDNRAVLLSINAAIAFASIMTFSALAWAPSFYIRHFGMTASQVGASFGAVIVIAGVLGLLLSGLVGDMVVRKGLKHGRLAAMAVFCTCAAPFAVAAPLADTAQLSLVLFCPALLLTTGATTLGSVSLQEATPNRMRGVSASLLGLFVNLLGAGAGPTIIALATDYVLADERKIGIALASVPPFMLLLASALAFFARAGSHARLRHTGSGREILEHG